MGGLVLLGVIRYDCDSIYHILYSNMIKIVINHNSEVLFQTKDTQTYRTQCSR